MGTQVAEDDEVRVDGRALTAQAPVHLVLHKPAGVITTASDPGGRRTVLDLIDVPERVFPVGRLDRDTTGLLIVTNDGELANRLMHPRHGVAKTYVAEVEGDPSAAALRRLAEGVELEDGPTAAAGVRRLAPSTIELASTRAATARCGGCGGGRPSREVAAPQRLRRHRAGRSALGRVAEAFGWRVGAAWTCMMPS